MLFLCGNFVFVGIAFCQSYSINHHCQSKSDPSCQLFCIEHRNFVDAFKIIIIYINGLGCCKIQLKISAKACFYANANLSIPALGCVCEI